MKRRIFTALPLAAFVLGALFWEQPWGTIVLTLFFCSYGGFEYFRMLREAGHRPLMTEGMLLTIAFLIASCRTDFDGLDVLFAAGTMGVLISCLFRRIPITEVIVTTAGTMFGALYTGYLGGFIIRLKMQGSVHGSEWGRDLLLLLFMLVWASDSFALWAGKAFGKTPLAPTASPKKTWEGAWGGALGALIIAVLLKVLLIRSLTWGDVVIVTTIIVIVGVLGDLCESLLKRCTSVKDSGGLLPGHGGVLDRIDSVLFAAPALYYYFHFVIATRGTEFWPNLAKQIFFWR